jgi:hypothetical protein
MVVSRFLFRPESEPPGFIISNYANSWSSTIRRMTAGFASGSPLLTEVDIARTDEGRARRSNKGVLR